MYIYRIIAHAKGKSFNWIFGYSIYKDCVACSQYTRIYIVSIYESRKTRTVEKDI